MWDLQPATDQKEFLSSPFVPWRGRTSLVRFRNKLTHYRRTPRLQSKTESPEIYSPGPPVSRGDLHPLWNTHVAAEDYVSVLVLRRTNEGSIRHSTKCFISGHCPPG